MSSHDSPEAKRLLDHGKLDRGLLYPPVAHALGREPRVLLGAAPVVPAGVPGLPVDLDVPGARLCPARLDARADLPADARDPDPHVDAPAAVSAGKHHPRGRFVPP